MVKGDSRLCGQLAALLAVVFLVGLVGRFLFLFYAMRWTLHDAYATIATHDTGSGSFIAPGNSPNALELRAGSVSVTVTDAHSIGSS